MKKQRTFLVTHLDTNKEYYIWAYDRNDIVSQMTKLLNCTSRSLNGKLKVRKTSGKEKKTYIVLNLRKEEIKRGNIGEIAKFLGVEETVAYNICHRIKTDKNFNYKGYVIVTEKTKDEILKNHNFESKKKKKDSFLDMKVYQFEEYINKLNKISDMANVLKEHDIYIENKNDFSHSLKLLNGMEVFEIIKNKETNTYECTPRYLMVQRSFDKKKHTLNFYINKTKKLKTIEQYKKVEGENK